MKEGKTMWTREELKMRGKMAFKKNYWAAVLVAFVVVIASGGLFNSVNSARNSYEQYNNGYNSGYNNGYYYSDDYGNDYSYDSGFNAGSIMSSTFGVIFSAMMGIAAVFLILLKVFIGNPLVVGGNRFFILNQTGQPSAGTLGYVFGSGNAGNVILTMFLKDLYISLWSLLFVIPGIVKSYEYMMVPYILAENPGMERSEAFLISKRMMDGQKWNAFVLDLSFIGWEILSVMTFGILGIFYVNPYECATMAELYTWNREVAYQKGFIQ